MQLEEKPSFRKQGNSRSSVKYQTVARLADLSAIFVNMVSAHMEKVSSFLTTDVILPANGSFTIAPLF